MTYDIQKAIARKLISKGLVTTAYICAYLIDKNGVLIPAYPAGNRFEYVGADDTKGNYAYIRENGEWQFEQKTQLGCSMWLYRVTIPMRVVFYGGDGNRDSKISVCMSALHENSCIVKNVITDKYQLFKTEQRGAEDRLFPHDKTYFAIDFNILQLLTSNECEVILSSCDHVQYKFC